MSSIQNIMDLQNIDSELKEIEDLLGDLPLKVSALREEESSLIQSIGDGKERLQSIGLEINKLMGQIDDYNLKIDKQKDQLFLVTNNRQYDALQTEIDNHKSDLDLKENIILELTEEKEELEKKVQEEEENLDELSSDLIKRRERLEELIGESSEKKKKLEKERASHSSLIKENILMRYNKIYEARDGLAVVPITGSGCGGCGAFIPPQIISEVRAKKNFQNCESCSRFLCWSDE